MKINDLARYIAVTSMMAATSQAAVVLQDSFAFHGDSVEPTDFGGGVYGFEIDTTGFSAAGHKLVLSYSAKTENDLSAITDDLGGAPFSTIKFNGAALTEALTVVDSNRGTAGIWYLDGVATDGILRLEITEADFNQYDITDFGVGLYALDGLKSGVQDTAFGSADADSTVTLPTASGFVVQEAVRNNQSLTPSGTDDFETLYSYSSNSYRGLQQYQVTSASGDYFAPTSNTASKLVMGAAFEAAIPEPSAALLGGLGALLLLRRRR